MGSRKKPILASLVSLTMVLAFAVGFGTSLAGSPSSGVKASEGSSTRAVGVDNQSSAGDAFAIPVGAGQGLSVFAINEGTAGPWLATDDVEWSPACPDGVALLSSAMGDYVATLTGLAPGEAVPCVAAGDVEWSLACPDGVAPLSSVPGDYVATLTALPSGEAVSCVAASDGRMARMAKTFGVLAETWERASISGEPMPWFGQGEVACTA